LVELLCYWEQKRRDNLAAHRVIKKEGDAMEVDPPAPPPSTPGSPALDENEWTLSPKLIDHLLLYLIRVIAATDQPRIDGENPSEQPEALLNKALSLWTEVPVKLEAFDRLIRPETMQPAPTAAGQTSPPDPNNRVAVGFRLIAIVLSHQFDRFCSAYANKFATAIPGAMRSGHEGVFQEICAVTKLIVERIPNASDPRVVDFYARLADGTPLASRYSLPVTDCTLL